MTSPFPPQSAPPDTSVDDSSVSMHDPLEPSITPKGGFAHGQLDAPPTENWNADDTDLDPAIHHAVAQLDSGTAVASDAATEDGPDALGTDADEVSTNSPFAPITDPDIKGAVEALYGPNFPLLKDQASDADWVSWAKERWSVHGPAVQAAEHLAQRNRLMRVDIHWISSSGVYGPWREPPKPRDASRVVDNMIGPALDQRVQIVAEQRPGFQCEPQGNDRQSTKRAEAQQRALEYQYKAQKMSAKQREAAFWNGTDGVAFWHVFWDPDKGPWDDNTLTGTPESAPGFPTPAPRPTVQRQPMGDLDTETLRLDQVRVSANASATQNPIYWVVRKTMPTLQGVARWGPQVAKAHAESTQSVAPSSAPLPPAAWGTSARPDQLYRDQPTVDQYFVYCEPNAYLPDGLMIVVVGEVLVAGPLELLFGRAPLIRVPDGSTDPSFYCRAIMNDWVAAQMRINALKSGWVDNIRVNKGGRFLGRENAIAGETFLGGLTSLISVKGPGAVGDNIQPVPGFSIGQDTQLLLEIEKKCFEDRSGWNDLTRGEFGEGDSGRKVLAQRETVERIFSPPVNAMADAMCQWGEITLAGMRWGYDQPRILAVEGKGRTDLAAAITQDDLDGVVTVSIDPETLMPMPRSLRLFLLQQLFQEGVIDQTEYRRRMPFAEIRDIDTPDTDDYERAQRVVQAIIETGNPQALPVLWQDDEAIHQDALEREILKTDEYPPNHPVFLAATQRWQLLAQQAAAKMPPPMPGGPMAPHDAPSPHHGSAPQLPPGQMPFAGQSPSVAAGTAAMMVRPDSGAAPN